jgi:hypothetical protein
MYLETQPQNALQIANYPIEKKNEPANVDDSEDGSEYEEAEEDDGSEYEEAEEDDDEVHEEDEEPCTDGNNAPNVEYDTEDPPMVVRSTK